MIRQLFCAALAWLVLASPTAAQPPAHFERARPAMQAFVDKGEISGVVTLVATKDKVLDVSATGVSDLASRRPMRPDDIFWIASMSKPITATAIAMLADDGRLTFDDPVAKFLPEFAGRPITLRDVLTHTGGVPEMTKREPHLTLAETAKAIAALPPAFEARTAWGYSTAGFDLLGRVVEAASGMPFDRFLQTRLFDPLRMTETTFWLPEAKKDRWARSYQWVAQESRLRETAIPYLYGTDVGDRARPPLGGAGLFSTAEDVVRFYQMMLNGGQLNGRRILKAATVAEMTRKQTGALRARPGMPWGLGFCVVEDPQAMEANKVLTPGSFGHGGAFSTQSWADPARDLIWIVMFQRTGKGNPDNSDVRIAFQNAIGGN
jgi:CubicO group peptidase (beta-lactamase class C family)